MSKEAPFDSRGNMRSYPGDWDYYGGAGRQVKMLPVEPFDADMRIVGMETGRSAKRIILQDSKTGKTYPLFVADIVKLLQDSVLSGTWEACKRGQNYGVRMVKK